MLFDDCLWFPLGPLANLKEHLGTLIALEISACDIPSDRAFSIAYKLIRQFVESTQYYFRE